MARVEQEQRRLALPRPEQRPVQVLWPTAGGSGKTATFVTCPLVEAFKIPADLGGPGALGDCADGSELVICVRPRGRSAWRSDAGGPSERRSANGAVQAACYRASCHNRKCPVVRLPVRQGNAELGPGTVR